MPGNSYVELIYKHFMRKNFIFQHPTPLLNLVGIISIFTKVKYEGKRNIITFSSIGAKTYTILIRVPLVLHTAMAEILCHHEFCVR